MPKTMFCPQCNKSIDEPSVHTPGPEWVRFHQGLCPRCEARLLKERPSSTSESGEKLHAGTDNVRCSKCGHASLQKDAKFCTICGARLDSGGQWEFKLADLPHEEETLASKRARVQNEREEQGDWRERAKKIEDELIHQARQREADAEQSAKECERRRQESERVVAQLRPRVHEVFKAFAKAVRGKVPDAQANDFSVDVGEYMDRSTIEVKISGDGVTLRTCGYTNEFFADLEPFDVEQPMPGGSFFRRRLPIGIDRVDYFWYAFYHIPSDKFSEDEFSRALERLFREAINPKKTVHLAGSR